MDIAQHLKNSLSPFDSIRKEAEAIITNFANEDLGKLILICSNILLSEQSEKAIRQAAAIIIKNSILNQKNATITKWINLEKNLREQIKENISAALSTEILIVKKAAASALASNSILK